MLTAIAPGTSGGGSHSAVGMFAVGIFFILVGGVQVLKPDLTYRMNRWQYKNKEAFQPSNAGLIVARVAGAVAVVIGIVLVVVAANK